MIYGIKTKNFVIREVGRSIGRTENQFYLTLLVDVLFGTQWDESAANVRRSFNFSCDSSRAELWKSLKDATNREILKYFFDVITENIEEYAAYLEYEKHPEYVEVVQGDGQEPVKVRKDNPHKHVALNLQKSLLDIDRSFLEYLIAIEPVASGYLLAELGE